MTSIRSVFEKVDEQRASNYLESKELPNPLFDSICWLTDRYLISASEARNEIRSFVKFESSFVFLLFARSMAEQAVRNRSEAALVNGLAALSIENLTFDSRDSYSPLAMLFHSTKKIGSDPTELFRRIASVSSEPMAAFFNNFLTRNPESQTLSTFGLTESQNTGGEFCYAAAK